MGDNDMKTMADALWSYFADKYMIPYLSDSVCYFQATVTSAPNGTTIGVQRPFDNAITLPYAWSASTLAVGDNCLVMVFGDMTNAIVVGTGDLSEPGIYVTKAGLLQSTGNTVDNTMSQDAITDALDGKADIGNGIWYGVCSTGAGTQTKAVTISGITALTEGLSIRVRFVNAQTYNGQAMLNLNSLGAIGIVQRGTTASVRYEWFAGEVVDFIYNGTNWVIVNGGVATTTYYGFTKLSNSTSSTSTSLAATPSAVKAAYDLADSKANPSDIPTAYTSKPEANGTADPGSSTQWARGDHVHPTDTTRAPVASPAFTGTPTAPTAAAGTSSTQIATTEFVSTATQKYVSELNAWISFQSDYFINISASQHGKGTTPNVDVYIKDGDYYYKYYGTPSYSWKIEIAETTGNVRIISSVPFQGRIIIT